VFEYEIPLDPQWELPRDKSAAVFISFINIRALQA